MDRRRARHRPPQSGLDHGPADVDRRHNLAVSGAFLLPWDVTLGAVWTLRSSLPFSALAGRDLNSDGANTDFVPGTTRNQGNRDLDLALVNAWRAQNGLAADLRGSDRQQPLQPHRRAREQGDRVRRARRLELIAQVFNVFGTDNLGGVGTGR